MLYKKTKIPITLILAGMLVGCGVLNNTPTPRVEIQPTELVQTLDTISTASAGKTAVAQLTQIAQAASPTAISLLPTATYSAVLPTATPVILQPTAVPAPVPCNWAQYVADVTYPDGSTIKQNVPFQKIWRMKNIGSCTWTPGYSLVFVSGYNMSGSISTPINVTVPPGGVADIGINLTSPTQPGNYTSYYQLRDTGGALFGIGPTANGAFWIKITVVAPSSIVYEMVPDASRASWYNSTTTITFGNTSTPAIGLAYSLANPQLENGSVENESGLVMKPDTAGLVKGVFPAYTIQSGDHFMTVIGCLHGHTGCKVNMQLGYSISGGATTVIATWSETYEGKVYKVDVDLSSLAGQNVNLVLTVLANGDATDDYALWLRPRIAR